VLGTDNDTNADRRPRVPAPVVNLGIPEIALFKWQKNRGVAEMRLFEFDGKTDAVVNTSPSRRGARSSTGSRCCSFSDLPCRTSTSTSDPAEGFGAGTC